MKTRPHKRTVHKPRGPGPAACALACLAAIAGLAQADSTPPLALSDGAVKVAIVYNFSKFVDWPPAQRGSGPLVLCVAGRAERLAEGIAAVEARTVHGRPLHVQEIARAGDLAGCHAAFFADPLGAGAVELLAAAHQRGVLTFSDANGFLQQGGLVQLVNLDNHVRFEVNLGAAQKAGFTISSGVLRLAERVVGGTAP